MGTVTQAAPADTTRRAEVVRADASHLGVLSDFIRRVWDDNATPERVQRARADAAKYNVVEPGRELPTFLFLIDGRVAGHLTTIPARIWRASGGTRAVYWVKGLEVLPEFQNGPVGALLLKEAVRQLGDALSMAVNPPALRLLQAVGFRDLGAVPNYVLPVAPARILERVDLSAVSVRIPGVIRASLRIAQRSGLAASAGAGAGALLRGWARLAGHPLRALQATTHDELDDAECDGLWRRIRAQIGAGVVRDGTYLRHRYVREGHGRYHFAIVRERGTLAGIAVVRKPRPDGDPRLSGIRVATLSDIVCPPDRRDIALATIAAGAAHARMLEAHAVLCTASHRSLSGALLRRGFLPIGGNVHFLARARSINWPDGLRDCWITRGDSDADEVF